LELYLEVDPTGIVIRSDPGPAEALVTEALADSLAGATHVATGQIIPLTDGYQFVELHGATPTDAQAAAVALRTHTEPTFATPLMRPRFGGLVALLNSVTVRFDDEVEPSRARAVMDSLGMLITRTPGPTFSYHRAQYPAGVEPLHFISALSDHPEIVWADPGALVQMIAHSTPGDPYYPEQYYLSNSNTHNGVNVDINVEPAWEHFDFGDGITVTVIDDGVDGSHPELTVSGQSDYAAAWCTGDGATPRPGDMHGTAVAGIVAAQHDSVGTVGIAPDVTLNSARINCNTFQSNPFQFGFLHIDSVAEAFRWAYDDAESDVIIGAFSLNHRSPNLDSEIEAALDVGRGGLGSPVVFSTGNTGDTVHYPALLSGEMPVISVSSIDRYGSLAAYAPEQGPVDLLAPSSEDPGRCDGDVFTTDYYGPEGCSDGPGGDSYYTSSFGGTSAAAPQVAGAAALLLAKEPGHSAGMVRQRLRDFADDWGPGAEYGSGKLNVFAALLGGLGVGINGPSLVPEYSSSCHWEAFTGVNTTGPVSYTWYKDGSFADTGDILFLSDTGGQSFELVVQASNPFGQSDADTVFISVAPAGPGGAPPCPPPS
jgi:subtilisin family serine protease